MSPLLLILLANAATEKQALELFAQVVASIKRGDSEIQVRRGEATSDAKQRIHRGVIVGRLRAKIRSCLNLNRSYIVTYSSLPRLFSSLSSGLEDLIERFLSDVSHVDSPIGDRRIFLY